MRKSGKINRNDEPTWLNWVFAVSFRWSKSFPVKSFCSKTQDSCEGGQQNADTKHILVWNENSFFKLYLTLYLCSDGFALTAPLGTQMAWTEPSDWLKADLRNTISVDTNSSLRSISWTDRQKEEEMQGCRRSDGDLWFNTPRLACEFIWCDKGAAALLWHSLQSQYFTRKDVFCRT